ncbi:cytochrome c3 family protein [Geomesophilobacter sediminis]|uniref:Cytochrome c3 family protein n=1 Tax=Geomesophilobacter sediminis TaxID=2798584 RepID=A0A8J7M1W9_9BACT|nr:cytochrome c3 family protein [Geomesophilobacter sediminis]MBJ6727018.1 cytochrome c3 family protein [Geomesophilobacter sediminis]
MNHHRNLVLAAVFLVCALMLPSVASAGVSEPFKCSMCHKNLMDGKVVHKPVGAWQCLRCHEQFSLEHPLAKGSIGFITEKKKLCATCHGYIVKKQFLHGPVGKGECTACHLAHSGEFSKLLKAPPPKLCYGCHGTEKFNGKHGHPPVTRGECLSCHDAHQADVRMLLRKPGAQLCFSCHDAKLAEGKSVHKPVAEGKCLDCHRPHVSDNRKLLKADFPDTPYRPFGDDAFPLCFSCHNKDLAAAATTDSATGFRNGTRNLHYVHVNKAGKGRNCKICHNPHAASQERLINPKSPNFGAWQIPINFTKTPTGGKCSVGCHKTFYYDREKPVGPQFK